MNAMQCSGDWPKGRDWTEWRVVAGRSATQCRRPTRRRRRHPRSSRAGRYTQQALYSHSTWLTLIRLYNYD